ncbi:Uncharacterized protein TCM_005684 [Theobroma cacao]|uniref:Uncharacterized protein n=1 Tax=Theobroma cacao TaxID=3641 RepID=A0A061DVJ3_THECC|nr:Uncharacterized protein TCM_005684 [Theobroma cacao]
MTCSVENAGLLCLKLQPNGKAISSTPGLSPSRKCFMSTYSLKTTWHSQQIKVDCNVVRPGKVLNWIIIVTEGCCKLRTAPYSLVASRLIVSILPITEWLQLRTRWKWRPAPYIQHLQNTKNFRRPETRSIEMILFPDNDG